MFWAFKLAVRPAGVPAHALPVAIDQTARGDPLRLFAAPAPQQTAAAPVPQAASRFKLVGVMAPRTPLDGAPPPEGLALIAVDGKPARPYAVGSRIDGEWVLQAVSSRTASIGPRGGTTVARLEVPPLSTAATGTLPPPARESFAPAPSGDDTETVPPPPPGVPGMVPPRPAPPPVAPRGDAPPSPRPAVAPAGNRAAAAR